MPQNLKRFTMHASFHKYQGTGNDFILIDDRGRNMTIDTQLFNKLCNRRFGIGADGLMLVRSHTDYDFEMLYFNADGNEGSMCGNGGRCIVSYARDLGIIDSETCFLAIDGPHKATIEGNTVSLQMKDVDEVEIGDDYVVLDTGSPHYVRAVSGLNDLDVVQKGREIRYNNRFAEKGINVNFVEPMAPTNTFSVRTYERGVEDETFACGTGVTAVAMAMAMKDELFGQQKISLKVLGGLLEVSFIRADNQQFKSVSLTGPAEYVFKGKISI